jgi:hypothetical protein
LESRRRTLEKKPDFEEEVDEGHIHVVPGGDIEIKVVIVPGRKLVITIPADVVEDMFARWLEEE